MKFLPLPVLSALLHAYIGIRLIPDLTPFGAASLALGGVLVVSALAMPLGLMASRVARPPLANLLTWLGLLLMGLFSSLFVLTLIRDVLLALLALTGVVFAGASPALQAFRGMSAEAVPLLGLLATLLGFWNARRTAAVVRVDVPITRLPAALQGFMMAQISDVHVGPTIRQAYLRRIVDRVNALGADLVAITGDLVDGKVSELGHHVAPLADLQSRHGTFFVTGNHEYYSGAHAWIAELRRLGLTVLMNEHVVLKHGALLGLDPNFALPEWRAAGLANLGSDPDNADPADPDNASADLVVAGVTDFSAHHFDEGHRSDPAAALLGAPPDAVRVLLAHQPRSAAAAAKAGFDLQLSGHTHGGQFWPWNLFVRFQQPFTSGLRRLDALWVYTSRGTGYWGPPKRFGAPSEITLLRLVAG